MHVVHQERYDSVVKDFSRRGTNFTVFDQKHADSIIDFVLRAQACERAETLYVNCALGFARSGAIVRFIADVLSLDEASFRELNSHIEPNQHVFCMLHKRWTERGLSNVFGQQAQGNLADDRIAIVSAVMPTRNTIDSALTAGSVLGRSALLRNERRAQSRLRSFVSVQ